MNAVGGKEKRDRNGGIKRWDKRYKGKGEGKVGGGRKVVERERGKEDVRKTGLKEYESWGGG